MHVLRNTLIIAVLIILFVGLQVLLSTRKSKYPGLIIPVLLFVAAILITSFASNIASGILAFLIASIPWILNAILYILCRVFIVRRKHVTG